METALIILSIAVCVQAAIIHQLWNALPKPEPGEVVASVETVCIPAVQYHEAATALPSYSEPAKVAKIRPRTGSEFRRAAERRLEESGIR